MTRVAVIIVNYNTGEDAVACLASAAADLAAVPSEAIVVDNASTDDSLARLTEPGVRPGSDRGQPGVRPGSDRGQTGVRPGSGRGQTGVRPGSDRGQTGVSPGSDRGQTGVRPGSGQGQAGVRPGSDRGQTPLRVVANDTNRGFGAAVNQAAQLTDAPVLWILNPDCRVEPGAFDALARTLDAHPECAIAAPQLLNEDGSVQASARGEPGAMTGIFGRHGLLTKFFPRAKAARQNLPAADLVASGVESAPVDWVMGASMLIRRDRFDEVHGFDEGYFLYWEDADLCRRLRDRGYTTRYVPGARVCHAGGASARTDSRRAIHAFHDSAYRYYATHVVRSPWHPARWFARVALALRARWRAR